MGDFVVAALVLALKVAVIPTVLSESCATHPTSATPTVDQHPRPARRGSGTHRDRVRGDARTLSISLRPRDQLIPVGFAIVLVAFFGLVARRNAVAQLVGFLLLENGIALVALVATARVSLVLELGAALDLLLAVLVLQVLTSRMRSKFGALDLDRSPTRRLMLLALVLLPILPAIATAAFGWRRRWLVRRRMQPGLLAGGIWLAVGARGR